MELAKIEAVEVEMSRLQKALWELRAAHFQKGVLHKAYWKEHKGKADSEVPWSPVKYWRDSNLEAPKLTGALKRSSMDLTRALAELRKP